MEKLILNFPNIDKVNAMSIGSQERVKGLLLKALGKSSIRIIPGFTTTAYFFWSFLHTNNIRGKLAGILSQLNRTTLSNINEVSQKARELIATSEIPINLKKILVRYYQLLSSGSGHHEVMVRSQSLMMGATSNFMTLETFYGVKDEEDLCKVVHGSFIDLYSVESIQKALSCFIDVMNITATSSVHLMHFQGNSSSGVLSYTPAHQQVVLRGTWGIYEENASEEADVYEFNVIPDSESQLQKSLGKKTWTKGKFSDQKSVSFAIERIPTPDYKRCQFVLKDIEVKQLANWLFNIENYLHLPVSLYWYKSGPNGLLYITDITVKSPNSVSESVVEAVS
ncbi:PEP/pyruvate-binding domain-containing protein [Rapidithrix thailandica]|uniref:Phosphoenolpyruvate synthase n=1 Tax=Rapidithrix thailandica TaxID=413964 RepID=A0AAW9S982_9BACT